MTSPTEIDLQALWAAASTRLHAWFVRRTGSAPDADDLVQETFLRAQAGLGELRDAERLDAWLRAIAGNVLVDRRRRREPLPLDADDAPARTEDEDDASELRRAVAGWIEAFLDRLGPEDAAVLRAVDLEGRSQAEVARELGLAPSGARSRVQRARQRLRKQLESCCAFALDARGNVTGATRRPSGRCGCDPG